MNPTPEFTKQLAIAIVVYGITILIIKSIPGLGHVDIFIHGWGWGVFLCAYSACFWAHRFFKEVILHRCKNFFKGRIGAIIKAAGAFINHMLEWVDVGLAMVLAHTINPALTTYSSAAAVCALFTFMGIASAVFYLLSSKIKSR
jgi:hypothetical protein